MNNKNIIKNYIYNMMYEIVALIIPLITTPYISRVLGATAIGDYGFTSGIVSYFCIIAALGTVNYSKREIAYNQKNVQKRSALFYEIFIFRLITTSIAILAYLAFLQVAPEELKYLYLIQVLTLVAGAFDISWFFQGIEDFKIIAIRNSVVKLLGTLCIFLFVEETTDLWKYTTIICVSNLIGNIMTWFGIRKYIDRVRVSLKSVFRHTQGIMSLFVTVIAIQVYTILDQTMIGIFANNTEVGYYTQAQKIVKIALMVISAFTSVLMPRIANLYSKSNDVEVCNYLNKSINFVLMLAIPMTIGCLVVSNRFVPIFFGDGYDKVSVLLKILSILFIIIGCGQLAGTTLISLKMQKEYTVSVCLGAIVNFLLNAIMIQIWWSIGASIASIIAECIVTIRNMYILNKRFSFIRSMIRAVVRYTVAGLSIAFIVFGLNLLWPNSVVTITAEIFIAVAVYFLILFAMKDEFILLMFSRIITGGRM